MERTSTNARAQDGESRLNPQPLSSVQRTEKKWLWKNRIPKGTLTNLEGEGGRGKSTIIADLCSRLSRGLPLEDDDTPQEPMKVLLLAAEDDPSCVLRPRFEDHGADLSNILFDDQAMVLDAAGVQKLRAAVIEHNIGLVVIDPIVSFLGRIDMNKGNDVRSVLGPLVKIGRETGCTFILVRHFNKNAEGSASQRGAGSVDFRNAARSVLQLIRSEEKSYLALEKSNYAAQAKTLSFTIVDSKVVWGERSDMSADQLHKAAAQSSEESRSAMDEAIEFLEAELKDGPRNAKEITKNASEMGIATKTLQRAKTKLGLRSIKLPSGWKWSKQDGQGGQESSVRKHDHVDHLDQLEMENGVETVI